MRTITITAEDGEVKTYQVPHSVGLKITSGKTIQQGDPITDGALYPRSLIHI